MNLHLNEDKKDILEQTGIPSQAIQAAFYIIYDFVFSICLVVNFTVLGWGWGFLVMADKPRQAGDFFKASNPLGPSLLQQLVPLLGSIS